MVRNLEHIEQFISRYPKLFHMAEQGSWPNIQRHGLLSTTALLDLFEITGAPRFAIESQWRPRSVAVEHQVHGSAVIRDQGPMPPDSLKNVLVNMTPQQWYEFINRKSFFWVSEERLQRLLGAALYRNKPHDVITVDTRSLVERHLERITLSPFNSGVSKFDSRARGLDTFQAMKMFLAVGGNRPVVELAVDYSVPDIGDLAISVNARMGTRILGTIWQS